MFKSKKLSSNCFERFKMSISLFVLETICMPIGKLFLLKPAFIEAAGWPVRLKGYV